MQYWRLLSFPVLAGFSAWQLWRAYSRGEVATRTGTVMRATSPIKFWLAVGLNVFILVVVSVAGGILGYHALQPRPLAERIAAFYPPAAARQHVEGQAILSCTVTPSWGVKDCSIVRETPPAAGFGPAAVQVAKLITLSDDDHAQAHPGEVIRLPIRFKLPAGKS